MKQSDLELDLMGFDFEPDIRGRLPVYSLKAICYSEDCNSGSKTDCERATHGTAKRVSKYAIFCPHCEHALFWERTLK